MLTLKEKHVRMFVNFAEEFSYNAGKLQTNKKYHSNDEMFTIIIRRPNNREWTGGRNTRSYKSKHGTD